MAVPGVCGPEGKDWAGTPQGQEKAIAGLEAYFSGDEARSAPAILLIHDVYGFEKKNLRLLADKFAAAGFFVVVPDFFSRDDVSKGPSLQEWLKRHPLESKWAGVGAVLDELRSQYHAPAVGVEGFCWGGHYAVQLAGRETGQTVQAAVIAHGSFQEKKYVDGIVQPTLYLFAEDKDSQIPADKKKEFIKVLETKPGSSYKDYVEAPHGWSLRGDDSQEHIARDAADAYEQALQFFKKNVS